MLLLFFGAGLALALALLSVTPPPRAARALAIQTGVIALVLVAAAPLAGCVVEAEETLPSGPPMCACDPPMRAKLKVASDGGGGARPERDQGDTMGRRERHEHDARAR